MNDGTITLFTVTSRKKIIVTGKKIHINKRRSKDIDPEAFGFVFSKKKIFQEYV
jgi:hypothetical protein